MNTLTRAAEMQVAAAGARAAGKTIGFVPTMGALHEGHLSLVRAGKARCDLTAVSIFVNPAQFGPQEDFQEYPRSLERDAELLRKEGVDWLFVPAVEEIYPAGFQSYVTAEQVAAPLEGRSRPGHFRGVATVVLKLFHFAQPHMAFFGQKDAQQCVVIRQLVRDLSVPVDIVVCPTVREPDGLALSSRNAYLSAEERQAALALSRSLRHARELILGGERRAEEITAAMRRLIEAEPRARVDYAELVDAETLAPRARVKGRSLVALAVWIGSTRLIDNLPVVEDGAGWSFPLSGLEGRRA